MATEMPDKAYRKIINSWAMYDWANAAFVTTIMAALFPPFYRSLAISAGLGEANATAFWAYTTSPLFRNVPEPPVVRSSQEHVSVVGSGFGRVIHTFRRITQYRQLLLFLIAFWIYNDGIGIIIKMATAYGDEIGIGLTDMVIALTITQFVGSLSPLGSVGLPDA